MKKLFIVLLSLFIFSSCTSTDEILAVAIRLQQNKLNDLHKIKRMTSDTLVINFVNNFKKTELIKAYEMKGYIDAKGSVIQPLTESKEMMKNYIDSLEVK